MDLLDGLKRSSCSKSKSKRRMCQYKASKTWVGGQEMKPQLRIP